MEKPEITIPLSREFDSPLPSIHTLKSHTHMFTAKFRSKDGKLLRTYSTNEKFPGKFFWKKVVAEQLAKVARDHDIPAESIFVEETKWQN